MRNGNESVQTLRHGINRVEQKLDGFISSTDARFNTVQTEIGRVEQKLDGFISSTDARFNTVQTEIGRVDQRITKLEGKVDTFKDEMYKFRDNTNTRFNKMDKSIAKLAELILRSEENRIRDHKEHIGFKEEILKKVDEGLNKINILYENSKGDTKLIAEGHEILTNRIDNHEERISKLEGHG